MGTDQAHQSAERRQHVLAQAESENARGRYRDDDYRRLLSLHADHDSAYEK
jgi:hypothetical protein